MMTCKNCKHFHRMEDGVRGGARGFCELKPTDAFGINVKTGSWVACSKFEKCGARKMEEDDGQR